MQIAAAHRPAPYRSVARVNTVNGSSRLCGSACRYGYQQGLPERAARAYRGGMTSMDVPSEIREFLSSRRALITPEAAGLPAYGGKSSGEGAAPARKWAMLAGVSVDYYVRMERGSLAGASETVLGRPSPRRSKLDEGRARPPLRPRAGVRCTGESSQAQDAGDAATRASCRCWDAITDAPAWIRNGRHDVLAMNQLARALYSPVLVDPRRPANTARFVYLYPEEAETVLRSITTRVTRTSPRCCAWRRATAPTTRS